MASVFLIYKRVILELSIEVIDAAAQEYAIESLDFYLERNGKAGDYIGHCFWNNIATPKTAWYVSPELQTAQKSYLELGVVITTIEIFYRAKMAIDLINYLKQTLGMMPMKFIPIQPNYL